MSCFGSPGEMFILYQFQRRLLVICGIDLGNRFYNLTFDFTAREIPFQLWDIGVQARRKQLCCHTCVRASAYIQFVCIVNSKRMPKRTHPHRTEEKKYSLTVIYVIIAVESGAYFHHPKVFQHKF